MMVSRHLAPWALLAAQALATQNFTIHNGQIFTPGFAVLNAPQPATPLGGKTLHISLDVTANGKLALPPLAEDSGSRINNITIFLYSYQTGNNFTVTNGTEGANGASLGDIMRQEEGSTVKHVNWVWPDCLVGDGNSGDDRGAYNISIRQNFRLNDKDYYTIFDVPISVTNSIEKSGDRPSCDSLRNELLEVNPNDVEENQTDVMFAPGDATQVEFDQVNDDNDKNKGEGLGAAPSAWSLSWSVLAMSLAGALAAVV